MADYAADLMQFFDRSPTAFHAVAEAESRLVAAGFQRLDERDPWKLDRGGRYYVVRQDASLIAIKNGNGDPADTGFRIVASHTDSPGFSIKTDSEHFSAGAVKAAVEVYGGPIHSSWLDRGLAIAGRVSVRNGTSWRFLLFNSADSCAIIPNLAIHLNRDANKGVELNLQTQMNAVLSVTAEETEAKGYIRRLVADRLKIPFEHIGEYDLYLCPAEPASLVGGDRDMIASGRIDNLGMSHAIITALLEEGGGDITSIGALFDSEEIGSMTWQGAHSSFLRDILHRCVVSMGADEESMYRALARSYLISGDAAHAIHPNYSEKHDEHFAPKLNRGPVVKVQAAKGYTTTAESAGRFINLCNENNIPVQKFIGRSDTRSGGTLGPVTSSFLGIPSVDVGNPIWGMHSARETAGVKDQDHMIAAVKAFFREGFD